MNARRPAFARRTATDLGAARDQGRPLRSQRLVDRHLDLLGIMAVHRHDMPAIGLEPPLLMGGHGKRGRPVDRDLVVVIEDDQPTELLMTRQDAAASWLIPSIRSPSLAIT